MQRGQDDRENQQVDQVVRMELTRESTYNQLIHLSNAIVRPIDVSDRPEANLGGFTDRGAGSQEEDEGGRWQCSCAQRCGEVSPR